LYTWTDRSLIKEPLRTKYVKERAVTEKPPQRKKPSHKKVKPSSIGRKAGAKPIGYLGRRALRRE
jgi:hypothetical protein